MEVVCLPTIAENLMTVSALIHAIQDQIVTLVRYNSAMYSYGHNIMGIIHTLVHHAAVCSSCPSPRVCLAPETCQCLPGYTGANCNEGMTTDFATLPIISNRIKYTHSLHQY